MKSDEESSSLLPRNVTRGSSCESDASGTARSQSSLHDAPSNITESEPKFALNEAVKAACAVAAEGDPNRAQNASDSALGTEPPSQDESRQVEQVLKKEKIKARWLIRERAIAYLKRVHSARAVAESLRCFPFDATRLRQSPTSLRESFALLFSQVILLYMTQVSSNGTSVGARRILAEWCHQLLQASLRLLQLTASPAQSAVFEAIDQFRYMDDMTCTESDGSHQATPSSRSSFPSLFKSSRRRPLTTAGTTLQELLNPQPAKWGFLAQCKTCLEQDIVHAFELAKLTDVKRLSVESHNDPQSRPRSLPETPRKASQNNEAATAHKPHIAYKSVPELTQAPHSKERSDISGCPSAPTLLLRDLLTMFILTDHYDARVQAVFDLLAESLDIHPLTLRLGVEDLLVRDISGSMRQDRKESPRSKHLRRLKVAGVAAGLGALTALTAGLAAPAIAAGFGALGIAGTSGAAGGSATMASIFGAGTAGLTGWKYSRRIGKIKVFQFDRLDPKKHVSAQLMVGEGSVSEGDDCLGCSQSECKSSVAHDDGSQDALSPTTTVAGLSPPGPQPAPPELLLPSLSFCPNPLDPPSNTSSTSLEDSEDTPVSQFLSRSPRRSQLSLKVTICISGWLRHISDIWTPWRALSSGSSDVYTLRWDPDFLLDLGNLVVTMLSQRFAVSAAQLWLQTTVAGALTTALMWPVAVLQYASTLDNAWMACRERAMQAGRLLADALCDRKTIGIRPVTLIGYSMGARIIFACLLELRRRDAFHLVSDVILLGTPTSCDKAQWQKAREVVSGRLVNVYSQADWLLGFLFRYMEWGVTVAGLSVVKVDGVENVDVTGIVRNHNQYADKVTDVLAYISYYAVPQQCRSILASTTYKLTLRLPCRKTSASDVQHSMVSRQIHNDDKESQWEIRHHLIYTSSCLYIIGSWDIACPDHKNKCRGFMKHTPFAAHELPVMAVLESVLTRAPCESQCPIFLISLSEVKLRRLYGVVKKHSPIVAHGLHRWSFSKAAAPNNVSWVERTNFSRCFSIVQKKGLLSSSRSIFLFAIEALEKLLTSYEGLKWR